ncbi:hypothetical protein [Arthrobacter bambusae]|uniref:hypothetical protein n=1 Tax=Arthrobacter bambusae TaxID=1338426 RepID=UPI00277FDB04|nr:hypothetical protein [Arthrobacter bambusae]MDQ0212202.1 hypothetical protein [Arthrobacter bambusae]MDQ0236579.1 hypothetical protein [Arthrobacter bambusae]
MEFTNVSGFAVLLDKDMKEAVPRQDAQFNWQPLNGGATYQITSSHEFDLIGQGKEIYYLAVGAESRLDFVSPLPGAPVEGGLFQVRGA